jgi:hypothetical protein
LREVASSGALIATLLTGAWRRDRPNIQITAEEFAAISPILAASRAAALVWYRIRDTELGSVAPPHFLESYQFHTLQAEVMRHEMLRVLRAFEATGIEAIVAKGWDLARLYPEPGLRPYGDIDLYVAADRLMTAKTEAAKLRSPYLIDLEHEEMARGTASPFAELLARSRVECLDGVRFRVLGPEDNLQLLCLHFFRHGAPAPLLLCDIAVALEQLDEAFDWELALTRRQPIRNWMMCALGLAHQLLGARVAAELLRPLPPWLAPAVLERWRDVSEFPTFVASWRRPASVLKELRLRWPNAIESLSAMNAEFDSRWPLPYQIARFCDPKRFRTFWNRLLRSRG